jgi:hypothetical protein
MIIGLARGSVLARFWAAAEDCCRVFGLTRKIAVAFLGCRGRLLSRFWADAEAHWMTFSRKRALPRFN